VRHRIAIAGAGFSGAVMARELAETGAYDIEVFEERAHLAGNCHTSRDAATGILLHHYGPHIFHTNRDDVWAYVNRFASWQPYTLRVRAVTGRGVFSLPINLLTINQLFGQRFRPAEAQAFVAGLGDASITDPQTFEEHALRFLGRDIYDTFFYGYTKKQWGVEPRQLPASILKRLPLRFDYDDSYLVGKYQGIPIDGYTALVERMLDHDAIHVRLGERFDAGDRAAFSHLFYSGPIDAYFGFELGRLQYRTLAFEREEAAGDYQGAAIVTYCEDSVPYTRITEHKHLAPWESHARTVVFREYARAMEPGDIPFYPVRLHAAKALLERYVRRASAETGVTFLGRLGTFRYLDMHVVIGEALDLAATCRARPSAEWPRFSASPL
jgi:UDP-galactopyranose mutase